MSARTHSFYDLKTGLLSGRTFTTNIGDEAMHQKVLAANTPSGCGYVDGAHDHLSRRVDLSGEAPTVVDYQPPQPSADHEWNGDSRRWVLNAAAQAAADARVRARARILELEGQQHRSLREAALGITGAVERLRAIEDEIVGLRVDCGPWKD